MSTERYDSQPTSGYPTTGGQTWPAIGEESERVTGYSGRTTSGDEHELTSPVPDQGYGPGGSGPRHAAAGSRGVDEVSAQGVQDVKDTTLQKASESKDVLLDRGADVAAVARDEAADLAREAQAHLRNLWSQVSGQLHEQASTAQHHVADLLHSLAGELGGMASKSDQQGPMTSLARQAATRGGALSHWLSNAETGDVLVEIRRFARRRPMTFLAGAATAGILVGRLGRSLMAGDDQVSPRPVAGAREPMTEAYGTEHSTHYADASPASAVPGRQYEVVPGQPWEGGAR